MALGKRDRGQQGELWVNAQDLPESPGHPFYRKLNDLLAENGFDDFAEGICAKFYHSRMGRPGIPPGVYFRMLLIGYFEGIDSERGIAWRCADSLALREFLGYDLKKATPEHSSLSVIRKRIDVETHHEVFTWVLEVLKKSKLLKGKTIGIDATTLEANAAMRSIIRKETGETYEEFLKGLAKATGIESPTREDLARMDRKRKKKTSNKDWHNPNDPDARIAKMKDGRTHLAHKAEHAVDLDTGAIVGVTLRGADKGDTATVYDTTIEAIENINKTGDDDEEGLREVVGDKGYHSNEICDVLGFAGIRSYLSEPKRGRRNWKGKTRERDAVYANRRRIKGNRGKALLRKRGELVERPFAHCYDTGGMRRTHLRGHQNILKRLLVHVAGFNLGMLMRKMTGVGKPKALQGVLLADIWGHLHVESTLQRIFRRKKVNFVKTWESGNFPVTGSFARLVA